MTSLAAGRPAESAAHPDSPALRLSEVEAGYGNTTVLRGVNLTVSRGQIVALLGPNGAGKTTLLRAASGLLKPSRGTVHVAGKDLTDAPAHRHARAGLCLIPEGRGIWRHLTVRENLRLQVPPWSRDTAIDTAIDTAVDIFPILGQRIRQSAGTLSGGQQQMLALARAFLSDPDVVLLDEVSMGLAPKIVDEIFQALGRLSERGVALLIVEQYVNRALETAHQVVLLDRGSVSFAGPPSELDEGAVLRGYLGTGAE
jgi:branched-chain amino acid transport system ATP-binding protein